MLRIYYADNSVQILDNFHSSFKVSPAAIADLVGDIAGMNNSKVKDFTFEVKGLSNANQPLRDKNKTVLNTKTKKKR